MHCEALRAIYTHTNSVSDARIDIELGMFVISKNAAELQTNQRIQQTNAKNAAGIPPWLQFCNVYGYSALAPKYSVVAPNSNPFLGLQMQ